MAETTGIEKVNDALQIVIDGLEHHGMGGRMKVKLVDLVEQRLVIDMAGKTYLVTCKEL
jgi:hypothetical protein